MNQERHEPEEFRLPAAGEDAREIDAFQGISGRQSSENYPWLLNVCRRCIRGGESRLFTWSSTRKRRFNVPERFYREYAR